MTHCLSFYPGAHLVYWVRFQPEKCRINMKKYYLMRNIITFTFDLKHRLTSLLPGSEKRHLKRKNEISPLYVGIKLICIFTLL